MSESDLLTIDLYLMASLFFQERKEPFCRSWEHLLPTLNLCGWRQRAGITHCADMLLSILFLIVRLSLYSVCWQLVSHPYLLEELAFCYESWKRFSRACVPPVRVVIGYLVRW